MDKVTVEAPSVKIIDSLRQQRQKIGAAAPHLFLDVPGYDGALVAEYQWTGMRDMAKALSRVKSDEVTETMVNSAAETLLACCVELHTVEDGQRVPLSTNGVPVNFSDSRLGVSLGFEADNHRLAVLQTFNNEYALVDHAAKVSAWLEDTTSSVNQQFVGE